MNTALRPYLTRSFALHGVLVLGGLLAINPAKIKSDKVYMIDFVGGAPVMQSAGAPAAAPAPERKSEEAPQKITQQADPDSLAVKGRATALPRPSLLKGWTNSKPTAQVAPTITGPANSSTGGAAAQGGSAGVTTDLPNFPYPWYISQVRQMLWAAWQKRMPLTTGEGTVVFSIMRNGATTDLRMESSSGDQDFDSAAMESVQAAAPFPALPADFAEQFLKIHLSLKSN